MAEWRTEGGNASALPPGGVPNGEFPAEAKDWVYAAIFGRRTIRRFRPDPVSNEVLVRLLAAAHHAPSVGFSQPWDFLLVRDPDTHARVRGLFDKTRQAESCLLDEPRRSEHLAVGLDSLSTAPLNLCVTCDPTRDGPHVLGSVTMPEAGLYSACLAVENLWLAARAEGVGVDWVSLLHAAELREVLGIPPHVIPVAYLCLGYPEGGFPSSPLLQEDGWRDRLSLDPLVRREHWDGERGLP